MTDVDLPYLDDEIVRMPADIRQDLATRGLNDLYFFDKAILGYRQMTPHCHGPLCVFHDRHPANYKLTLIPRGTFKTSALTIGKNTQKALKDTNRRICIINEVAENAQGFLDTIRQHFEGNRVLRALYSSAIPKDVKRQGHWNSQGLRLVRDWVGPEDTIEAMGVFSTLTSHHYTDLVYDDVISEDAVKSPLVMEDTIGRVKKFRSLMVNPSSNSLDITGTRWALHDVYSHFLKVLGPYLGKYIRGAIGPDGDLMFPELLDAETLARLREEYEDYMFSCLYMNNPRDVANQDFNVQDLRSWRWTADEEHVVLYGPRDPDTGYPSILREWHINDLDITTSVDLAVAEAVNSDRNAIVTVGASPLGEAIVLDTFAKRCTPLEVMEHLFWLKRRYPVRTFGIEGVAYQKAFKYFLKAECERRQEYMNVMELKSLPSKRGTGNNSKFTRIRGLQPVVATGRMYVGATMHMLRNEMADFPLGEHDDVIDALAMQLQMWRGILSPERMAKYKASEEQLMMRVLHNDGLPESVISITNARPQDIPHMDDLGVEVPRFRNWQESYA